MCERPKELEIVERDGETLKVVAISRFTNINKVSDMTTARGYIRKYISEMITNALDNNNHVNLQFV